MHSIWAPATRRQTDASVATSRWSRSVSWISAATVGGSSRSDGLELAREKRSNAATENGSASVSARAAATTRVSSGSSSPSAARPTTTSDGVRRGGEGVGSVTLSCSPGDPARPEVGGRQDGREVLGDPVEKPAVDPAQPVGRSRGRHRVVTRRARAPRPCRTNLWRTTPSSETGAVGFHQVLQFPSEACFPLCLHALPACLTESIGVRRKCLNAYLRHPGNVRPAIRARLRLAPQRAGEARLAPTRRRRVRRLPRPSGPTCRRPQRSEAPAWRRRRRRSRSALRASRPAPRSTAGALARARRRRR